MYQAIFRHVLLLLILATSCITVSYASENRVALVIGNSAYRHAAVLDNPKNDAADIAAAVEKLGFKVVRGLDLDRSGMERAVREFAATLRGASIGMFFYAGHGLQVNGRNYLVPIDAELKTAEALDYEMVSLDSIQRAMENASETNVLFVDACRDNPLSRNLARAMGTRSGSIGRGLVVQEAGAGTLISFSTQPGNVALDSTGSRNSPYAAALAKHIATQGKDLSAILLQVRRDVMTTTGKQQIPWEHSALTAEVMLAPQAMIQTSANAVPKAEASDRNTNDRPSSEQKASELKAAEAKTATIMTAELETKPEAPKRNIVSAKANIGYVVTTNTKRNQYLMNAEGNMVGEALLPERQIAVPPGRYRVIDAVNTWSMLGSFVSVEQIDIKSGEKTVIDLAKYVGEVRTKGTQRKQYLANAKGERVGAPLLPNEATVVPAGAYQLIDDAGRFVSVNQVEVKPGEETVIDFGN
jgi:uncharacterized caspase-like protein